MRLTYRFCAFSVRQLVRFSFGLIVRGVEKVPESGKAIIAANHQSYLDPPILGACLRREAYYLAKADLFKYPIFSSIIRHLNAVPLKRSEPDFGALREAVKIINSGQPVVVFPEGGLGPTEELRPGGGGVGFLARQTGAEVYPVFIKNTRRVWRRLTRSKPVELIFGDAIRFVDVIGEDQDKGRKAYIAFSREVMNQISALRAANP